MVVTKLGNTGGKTTDMTPLALFSLNILDIWLHINFAIIEVLDFIISCLLLVFFLKVLFWTLKSIET